MVQFTQLYSEMKTTVAAHSTFDILTSCDGQSKRHGLWPAGSAHRSASDNQIPRGLCHRFTYSGFFVLHCGEGMWLLENVGPPLVPRQDPEAHCPAPAMFAGPENESYWKNPEWPLTVFTGVPLGSIVV